MTKLFGGALLALGGLTGCAHVATEQSVEVDAKTRLNARLEGASLRATLVPGTADGEPLHRVVENLDGKVLFAYDLELGKGSADGSHYIRLKPSKQKPTFAAVREVTVKSDKESVRVELMENPGTGEKVADLLQLTPPLTAHELKAMSPMEHVMRLHNMIYNHFHGH